MQIFSIAGARGNLSWYQIFSFRWVTVCTGIVGFVWRLRGI